MCGEGRDISTELGFQRTGTDALLRAKRLSVACKNVKGGYCPFHEFSYLINRTLLELSIPVALHPGQKRT